MSLTGNIHKISGDVRRAVSSMTARDIRGLDGTVRGTKKIFGYVCDIHTEGELAGTIDVQEFNYEPDEYEVKGAGLHKGVLLSAIQDNKDGIFIVPMMYSEVVIVQNPIDGCEYVLMYSHAQKINLSAHSVEDKDDGEIKIEVVESKSFEETNSGLVKDYDELEPTKHKVSSVYKSKSITHKIVSPDDQKGFSEESLANKKTILVGDTKIVIEGNNITVETSSNVNIKAENCKVDGKNVTITGGKLNVKGMSNTDLNGPFNSIKACPFSGAPHCGSIVSGT